MPNWCNNHITLQHEDPAMIKRAFDAMERGEFLQEFIPVPKDLTETVSGFVGEDKQAAHEAQMEANLAKHGYKDWYDFCVGEWGTKWDCGEQGNADINPNDPTMMTAGFDTAWSPPITAYEKLLDLGFSVKAGYYEGGMCYAGLWEDGVDDYYDLSNMDSQAVVDGIPSELDELFGISETIAEYEAENEEELTQWIREGAEENKKLGLIDAENL
jgi:hypothetical protein